MARVLARDAVAGEELHDRDFYSWCRREAGLIGAGRAAELDLQHLAEELTISSNELERSLRSSYRVLLMHLLKWQAQPTSRSRSWRLTIAREREEAEEIVVDNPGMKPHSRRLLAEAYRRARKEAARETSLPLAKFPTDCTFTLDQALDEEFWPEPA